MERMKLALTLTTLAAFLIGAVLTRKKQDNE